MRPRQVGATGLHNPEDLHLHKPPKRSRLLVAVFLFAVPAPGLCQGGQDLPAPDKVVKPRVYVSLDRVPQGQAFDLALLGEILPGFHINANKVLQDYLIPTSVEPTLPAGFRLTKTSYPQGRIQKFEFSEEKLSVYDGTVTVRLSLQAPADAPPGKLKIPLTLRYQACNDRVCLPPVKIPLAAEIEIAPAGAKSRQQHAEIFHR